MRRTRSSEKVINSKSRSSKSRRRFSAAIETLETRQLLAAVNPNVIDIFIGYTAADVASVGSQQNMVDDINRGVAFLNQAMYNSKVQASFRLVGTMQSNYVESGVAATDLAHLDTPTDPQMADLKAAATAAGADITDIVVSNLNVGGITQLNYNVINLQFLTNGVLSHEIGHSLGAGHPRGTEGDGSHTTDYAYEGTLNFNGTTKFGAVGGDLPYYSNPNVSFLGQPTGIAPGAANSADNALVMNNNAPAMSAMSVQKTPDTTGPVVQLGTVSTPIGQNLINFNVRFEDGSGVNVSSLGNNNILVTGPNGFSAMATLVSVGDSSVNYGFNTAVYQVATPSAVGDLTTYSFAVQGNSIADTVGNFTPAGPLTSASTPLMPIYADAAPELASDEGNLAGQTVVLSDEVGSKYQSQTTQPKFRFSLSTASTLTIASSNPSVYQVQLYQDSNFNLTLEPSELIQPSAPGVYTNLPAGSNYYINISVYSGGPAFGNFQVYASFQSPGSVVIPPSTLSGVVFSDTNGNGTQDAGEPGIAGTVITLTGNTSSGQAVNVTVNTDANGNFIFTGLQPSDNNGYALSEQPPANIPLGPGIPGTFGGSPYGKGQIYYVLVGPGSKGTGYGFADGVPVPNSTISGTVFYDINNNGVQDAGEAGIPGVSLSLYSALPGSSGSVTVQTDANGNYQFTNVAQGVYSISETQPANVLVGKETAGTLGGSTVGRNSIQIIRVSGVNGTGYLFAHQPVTGFSPPPPTTTGSTTTTPQGTGTSGNVNSSTNISPVFDLSNGFANAGTSVTYNGNAGLSGSVAQLTPLATSQAGSMYYSTKVNVAQFNTQFSFSTTAGPATADGITFVIQNAGVNALGAIAGGLGYQGIGTSVAVKFDLWNNSGEGPDSTGLYINGATPTNVGSIDLTPTGVDLHNGDTLQVNMSYDGTTLTVTIKDPTTGKTASQSYPINIPGTVGGNTAYVGFTGGTGGAATLQTVNGWTYAAAPVTSPAVAHPDLKPALSTLFAQLIPGTGPYHALSFSLNSDGTYNYVPMPSFVGTDSFTYQVVDQNGRTASATVTIIVTHVHQVPAIDSEVTYSNDTVEQGNSIYLNLNTLMTDPENDMMMFGLGKVTGGTAKLLPDGHTVQFTASSTFVGKASVTYFCGDALSMTCLPAIITVTPVPKKPTAGNVTGVTLPSTAVSLNVLPSDTDPEHVHLCIQSVATPANGTATILKPNVNDPTTWRIVYRPNFGFHGTDSFKYTIVDFYGTPATGTISVTVDPGAGIGIDPTNSKLTALDIFGTPGNDTIDITNNAGNIAVTLDGILLGNFNPTGLIAAFGGAGNDTIDASGVSQSVMLFGDAGNDTLISGSGPAILVGGAGSDTLIAGSGKTEIITGTADYTTKGLAPLTALFNGSTNLSGYVHDDDAVDQVYYGTGFDTVWATETGTGLFDVLHGRVVGEPVFGLS